MCMFVSVTARVTVSPVVVRMFVAKISHFLIAYHTAYLARIIVDGSLVRASFRLR